jgi:hypothetical protein
LLEDVEDRSIARAIMACVLASNAFVVASEEAWRAARAVAKASKVGLRSLLSPMVAARDVAVESAGAVVDVTEAAGLGLLVEGACVADGVEDRDDRGTRLSRASNPRIPRPRLRSS